MIFVVVMMFVFCFVVVDVRVDCNCNNYELHRLTKARALLSLTVAYDGASE